MKRIGFWNTLGVLVGALVTTPVLATELVVYKADGGGYAPGQTIDSTHPLTLKAGQRVTLLAANGAILNLEGPYHDLPLPKTVAATDTGVMDTLKMLVSAPKTRSGGLGTTRNAANAIEQANARERQREPWVVDVSRSGNYCLAKGQPLVFWRPASQEAATITVRYGEDLWRAHTRWPAGKDRLTPPVAMPIADGGTYHLDLDGLTTTAKVHLMPSGMTSQEARAAWMTGKGCVAQTAALKPPSSVQ
ncbi:MAG: hypothetical protein HQM02_11950 [Magnetococcales bacterium]|nr:hypothetical protein [Magnetococcales bacterium]